MEGGKSAGGEDDVVPGPNDVEVCLAGDTEVEVVSVIPDSEHKVRLR